MPRVAATALAAVALNLLSSFLHRVAVAGEEGLRSVLELLRTEVLRDLMLCGRAPPAEVERSLVVLAAGPNG